MSLPTNKKPVLGGTILVALFIGFSAGFYYLGKSSKAHDHQVLPALTSLVAKYNSLKNQEAMDLSADQDLVIAVMNLISIEEHLFFTGAKTGKDKYYSLIDEVREARKKLLKKLLPEYEGEVWCISKHLLAASYRLMETGTKQLHLGNKLEANELFSESYKLYSMFWQVKLGVNKQQENKNESPIAAAATAAIPTKWGTMIGSSVNKGSSISNVNQINCCNE